MWYRQAAKALGWCDRHKFPTEIENLLKTCVWPDGEAERREAQSAIDHPNKTHKIDVGSGDERGGHRALGRVPRFGVDWGDVGDVHIAIGPLRGSSRKEWSKDHGPGSTSAEVLVFERGSGDGFVVGSGSGDPVRTAITYSWERARSCTGAHDTQANAHDMDGGGWTTKWPQVAHPMPGDTH